MTQIRLRVASAADAEALLAIYAPYVRDTAVSFESEVPDAAAFRARIEGILSRYPYLCALRGGAIVGYAYLGPFRTRAAYRYGAECTVYVKADCRGTGVGRRLYGALTRIARLQNLVSLYACITCAEQEDAYSNTDSLRFHARMGYEQVGLFPRCGYKFGRWYGVAWMEKRIGERGENPPPFTPFPALSAEAVQRILEEESHGQV